MTDIPVILRCPRGDEWPAESFTTTMDFKAKVQTHETIRVICPAGHGFTLKKAVEKGMFTPDQALKIIAEAQRRLPEARKKARRLTREWKKELPK